MLQELGQPRRESGGLRRWFHQEGLDLYTWQDGAGRVSAWQLAYQRQGAEHLLSWRQSEPPRHYQVDPGEENPKRNMTPLLGADGRVPWGWLAHLWRESAGQLPEEIRQPVARLLAIASPGNPTPDSPTAVIPPSLE